VLCSAVFVSGRGASEAQRNSAYFFAPAAEREHVVPEFDRSVKEVRAT
jgi:hypothetical protein